MAGSVNKVILIGRLGQDPKLNYLPSGQAVAELSVATDESYKNKDGQKVEQTEWHRVKVFGKSAEFCGNYLAKGRLVYVEGTLKTRSWDDKDGQKRYVTEIVVSAPGHSVQFMDSKSDGQGQQGQPHGQGQQQRQHLAPRQNHNRHDDLGPAFPSDASGLDDVPFAVLLWPLAGIISAMLCSGGIA